MSWFRREPDSWERRQAYIERVKRIVPDWEATDDWDVIFKPGDEQNRWQPGSFWVGETIAGRIPVGITHDRHNLTVAGARTGKGVGVIIPNLLLWPHNALVIDPKGEAAVATAEARAAMGQAVHVLDPFGVADVPEHFKARVNLLQGIKRESISAREDIGVIADGLVMRHDSRAGHWDGGGLSLIAGLIAYVLDQAPPDHHTLPEIRKLLTVTPEKFAKIVAEMATNGAFGNLPATAASKLTKSGNEAGHFVSVADENTKWLDSDAINAVLSDSTFDLADLKTKPCTVYLVLPAHLLGEHGRFLRLFVRAALNAMAKGGTRGGRRCLFLLDEFHALGHIEEIAKAAGLMPGYGVHLWPVVQDVQQIDELYGREGWGHFTGNASLVQFFGNTDTETLERLIGMMPSPQRDKLAEIREHVAKRSGMKVARRMLAFLDGEAMPYNLRLTPYFDSPHFG